jgi:hypothetical protein
MQQSTKTLHTTTYSNITNPCIELQTWVEPRSHCISVNGYERNHAQYTIVHLKPVHQEACNNIFKYIT